METIEYKIAGGINYMLLAQMSIEASYVFLSLLLLIYCVWRYLRQRERHLLYFALGFTFLTFSTVFQTLNSTLPYGIYFSVSLLRLLELVALALFLCFTVCAIMALRKRACP